MTDTVDVVAQAICNTHCGDIEAWEVTFDKGREHWRAVARAAIDSMGIAAICGEMTKVYAPLNPESGQPMWHEWYDDIRQGEKAAHAEQRPLGEAWISPWKVATDD